MNEAGITRKVVTIVSDQLGRDAVFCTADAKLIHDLGADSLDLVSIVLDVETELGCEIPKDAMEAIVTLGDVVRAAAVALDVPLEEA